MLRKKNLKIIRLLGFKTALVLDKTEQIAVCGIKVSWQHTPLEKNLGYCEKGKKRRREKKKENVSLALRLGAKTAVFTSAKSSADLMGVLINTFA